MLLPLQFYHLLPLDNETVIHYAVTVVVAQEPVIELAHPLDRLEEIRQPVREVVSVQLLLDNEELCALAKGGDTEARNQLLKANLSFVQQQANKIWGAEWEWPH